MSVIELDARYRLSEDHMSAKMTLSADLEPGTEGELNETSEPIILTLLHERFLEEAGCYDFLDSFALPLEVRIGESITVIARRAGRIVGSLVNEVNTAEESRVLLLPKGGYNVIVYQEREQEPAPRECGTKVAQPWQLVASH